MIRKITILAKSLCALLTFCCAFSAEIYSQNRNYANAISSQSHIVDGPNAINGDLSNSAIIQANSGIALGAGAYSGFIELGFDSTVAANNTSFIKIDTQEDILSPLVGGSLGNLLSTVLGVVLIGNQEFAIEAKLGNSVVFSADSSIPNAFGSLRSRIIVDDQGEYYVAITPDQEYDRIKIINRTGSLLGLNTLRTLSIAGAFYGNPAPECAVPQYTSYDGSGLTLDLLDLGNAGVRNPEHAIDQDPTTASTLSLGIIDVAASISQLMYLEKESQINQDFKVRLKVNPSLIALDVLDNIQFTAYNQSNSVASASLSSLIDLDLLGLLQNNTVVEVPFRVGAPVDRIEIRLASLLGVNIAQELELYDVSATAAIPLISENDLDLKICAGETTVLVASSETQNAQINWYDTSTGGTALATVNSGEGFTTPALNTQTTFYASAIAPGCDVESARVAVTVDVNALPESGDISILGLDLPICVPEILTVVPTSLLNGNFKYYIDAQGEIEITDGLIRGELVFNINAEGELEIEGLTVEDSPYQVFVGFEDAVTGCSTAPGDLKVATIQFAEGPEVDIQLNAITADGILNRLESLNDVEITGTVIGDATVGQAISIFVNEKEYITALKSDFTFSEAVLGSDLAADQDLTVEARITVTNLLCNATDNVAINYTLDLVDPTLPSVNAQTTNDNTPTITGTADSADTLTVEVNGVIYTEGDGNLTDNGDDTWTLNIPDADALPDGVYDVVATATDDTGNVSMDVTIDELTIDSLAPTTPTVDAQTTNDNTPIITGTADSADLLTVEVNGVIYTEGNGNLIDNGDDTWTLNIPDADALPDGVYDVVATATDDTGNVSGDLTIDELTIDSLAPKVPTVDAQTTNDNTPIITGTADSAALLT